MSKKKQTKSNEWVLVPKYYVAARNATIKRNEVLREILPPADSKLYMLKSDLNKIDLAFWSSIPVDARPALLERYPALRRGLAEQEAIERVAKRKAPRLTPEQSLESIAASIGGILRGMAVNQA